MEHGKLKHYVSLLRMVLKQLLFMQDAGAMSGGADFETAAYESGKNAGIIK